MDAFIHRRLSVASCWASARIAVLDSIEHYEDSYAITQEFREWITCLGENPEHLADSLLMVPQALIDQASKTGSDIDEPLEI